MSRELHSGAVQIALQEITDIQEMIGAAKDHADRALGAVGVAVGGDPAVESARMAMAWAGGLPERLEELVGQCEAIKSELTRYAGGF
jgi:hypothetical protein